MNRKLSANRIALAVLALFAFAAFCVADLGALAQNANSSTTDTGQGERTEGGEKADLSGTYTGRLTMRGGHEMAGEVTLTITGDSFTLAGEGMNHSGRVLAVTTRGYTGASFFFTDIPNATTKTPVVAAVRARKSANRLTLTPVPGASTRMTFNGRSS